MNKKNSLGFSYHKPHTQKSIKQCSVLSLVGAQHQNRKTNFSAKNHSIVLWRPVCTCKFHLLFLMDVNEQTCYECSGEKACTHHIHYLTTCSDLPERQYHNENRKNYNWYNQSLKVTLAAGFLQLISGDGTQLLWARNHLRGSILAVETYKIHLSKARQRKAWVSLGT